MQKPATKFIIASPILIVWISFQACNTELISTSNEGMRAHLSDYNIYLGNPANLIPNSDFTRYELSTPLFTDYAEKQRLLKLPSGTVLIKKGDGLPEFPEGSMLVKTFFYYHDERDKSKGIKIIETRILIKLKGENWNAGTYLWNSEQSEATLINSGINQSVNWINRDGVGKMISYHVPSVNECGTCHNSNRTVIPIGPKLRNLNVDVNWNNEKINQLQYLINLGVINDFDVSSVKALPGWNNSLYSLEERTRAYLDVNCAHCHNEKGFASDKNIWLDYEIPLFDTRLIQKKGSVINEMENGKMPKLGTATIDEEGLALIKSFLESQ